MGSPGIGWVRLCVQLHHKLTRGQLRVYSRRLSSTTAGGYHHQLAHGTHTPTHFYPKVLSQGSPQQAIGWCVSDETSAVPLIRPHRLSKPQPVAWAFSIMMLPTRIRDPVCQSWLRSPSFSCCREELGRESRMLIAHGSWFNVPRSGIYAALAWCPYSWVSCLLSVVHFWILPGIPSIKPFCLVRLRPTA